MTLFEPRGNGNDTSGDIMNHIEEWKRIGSRKELHEYLGMSFEQLVCFFIYPDKLEGILRSENPFRDYPVDEISFPSFAERKWKDYRRCPECDELMHERSGYVMHSRVGNIFVDGKYRYCSKCGHEQFPEKMKQRMEALLEERKKKWCMEGIMPYGRYPEKYISISDFAKMVKADEKDILENRRFNEEAIYADINGTRTYFLNRLEKIYRLYS